MGTVPNFGWTERERELVVVERGPVAIPSPGWIAGKDEVEAVTPTEPEVVVL